MAAIPIITPTPGRRAIAACGQLLLVSGGLVLLRLAMRVGVRGESIMIKSGHLARKFPACFALLVTAGLFTLVFSMLSPSFQTNDDTQMMMIASGKGIGLAPDEHIVFSNVVIGQVLKALYGAYPAIPWYGVYLYFVQYLAYSSLLYCVIVPGFTRWRLALYVLYFAGVGIFSLNNLQFTTVACVAGQKWDPGMHDSTPATDG